MKSALVTGASSGIGKAISLRLLKMGYKVYGMAREFDKSGIEDEKFVKINIDLIKEKNYPKIENLTLLINCAGFGKFAPHEELNAKDIEQMIALNLTAPLLLSNFYLRELKKRGGFIININSISGLQPALFGAVYGASKAALRHFGISLFKEARKSGLKVVNINPDLTNTPFFKNLHFGTTSDPLSFIEPSDIAKVVEDVINHREGTVLTDITVEPQIFKIEKKSAKN
ncbi:MAG: 3-oxoacyl-ACP reductase [Sulfurospirillum sp.]|nr:MAG: 3-oxoacyl-ACP reductase [Sulfurospirillum sp.]